MQNVRRLIYLLSSLIGLWVLISFAGAMVNASNAEFWTTSLMWALLSCLLVMPALVVINHASSQHDTKQSTEASANVQVASAEQAQAEQEPFIKDAGNERTLWPNSEEQEWPPQESKTQT